MITFIIDEKGEEVISERNQKDYKRENIDSDTAVSDNDTETSPNDESATSNFTDVDFDDI